MKKIFDIVEKKVLVNENILLIPAFKRIVEEYDDRFLDVFTFIYYYCDYKSPFSDYSTDQKEEKLMELFNPDGIFTLDDQVIIEAVDQYNSLQKTASMELLEGAKIAMHKMAEYLRNVSIIDGRDGNIAQISGILKQMGSTVSSFEELQEQVEKEMEKSTVRGGKHVSSRER